MTGLNINHLPPEMIGEIMQHLDVKSLKNAALTCKLWNNVIESTCRWPLQLSDREHGVQEKMNFILTTKRKIGSIEVRWSDFVRRTEIYEIFRKHGANVVKLVLFGGHMDSVGALADLLNFVPNLERAVITIGPLPTVRELPSDYILPAMEKLKQLDWCVCDQRLITCFRNAKITTMKIWEIQAAVSHYGSLVEFLSSQDTLTSLTVTNNRSTQSILVEIGELLGPISLRLTNLSISFLGLPSTFNHDNLLALFESKTEKTQMEIGDNTSRSVDGPVFALTKPNSLIVSIHQLPQYKNFHFQLKRNHSVQASKSRI